MNILLAVLLVLPLAGAGPAAFSAQSTEKVMVTGQVRSPGAYDFREGLTVGEAIQLAGGYADGAARNRLEVARKAGEKTERIAVDESFVLQAADVVVVPRRRIYRLRERPLVRHRHTISMIFVDARAFVGAILPESTRIPGDPRDPLEALWERLLRRNDPLRR